MTTPSQRLHIFTYCFPALHGGSDCLIPVKDKNMFNICFHSWVLLLKLRWKSSMSHSLKKKKLPQFVLKKDN